MSEKVEGSGRRLLLMLEVIAGLDSDFSLKDLTARSGLPTTTVHRLLQILLEDGLVEKSTGQTYRPGVKFLRLASSLLKELDVNGAAQPVLQDLWGKWQETAVFALYRPNGRTAMVIDTIAAPHPLRFVMERYTEVSLPWGSFGRAILAHLPPHEMDAVIAARQRSTLTGREPIPVAELQEALSLIRSRGYAVFVDLAIDVAGVAAPIFGPQRTVVGSLGLAMPGSRFTSLDQEAIGAAMVAGARKVSETIGWMPI